ncbi:MAG: PEFG-CTERM sorting domain-containing protein [Thaumarchaeota archaeon]|nr:PEFG-CTERM sorting domain-containing protein [Nitrososphaerota archaeon]
MHLRPYAILAVLVLSLASVPSFAQLTNSYTVKNPQGGQSYTINYTLTGATISDVQVNTHDTSLVILINSTSDGNLVVDMPRSLIDAKAGANDDNFIVLVDDTYTSFHETKTGTDRTLSIAFNGGTERIEIIGTQVLPEFGSVSVAILAMSVVSIVVISARSRFKFGF